MFSKNPKRVAEKQLNKAELDLLEVCEHLESYESNKRTLEQRIARLRAYVNSDADQPEQVDERSATQRLREVAARHQVAAEVEISSLTPRASY
jgi:hypothetical protein